MAVLSAVRPRGWSKTYSPILTIAVADLRALLLHAIAGVRQRAGSAAAMSTPSVKASNHERVLRE